MRIDVPLRGVKAHQPHRPLRVFQGHRRFRVDVALAALFPVRPRVGNAVLQQDARDSLGSQPVADLGAFQIHGQYLIAAARKHDHRGAGVFSRGRIDGHRRLRDVVYLHHLLAANQIVLPRRLRDLRPRGRLRIGHSPRPDRHLRMSRRWLPARCRRSETGKRKHSKDKKLHQDPHSPI